MMKKILASGILALSILSQTIPVFAETVQFDVTMPGDPYSYTVRKADSEQRYYVSGTWFSNSKTLTSWSLCTSESVSCKRTFIKRSSPKDNSAYTSYAKAGKIFNMYSSGANGLHVIGRYTP